MTLALLELCHNFNNFSFSGKHLQFHHKSLVHIGGTLRMLSRERDVRLVFREIITYSELFWCYQTQQEGQSNQS
jgi:hypothetical protein